MERKRANGPIREHHTHVVKGIPERLKLKHNFVATSIREVYLNNLNFGLEDDDEWKLLLSVLVFYFT